MRINRNLRTYARIYRLLLAFYNPRVYKPFLWCCFIIALVACKEDPDEAEAPPPTSQPSVIVTQAPSESVANSVAAASFELNDQADAFQIVAYASDEVELRLLRLVDSGGNIIFDSSRVSDQKISSADEFQPSPLTFNYPLLADSPELIAGRYAVEFETRSAGNGKPVDSPVTLDLITKNDADFAKGTIRVNLLLGDVASNSTETKNAISGAMRLARVMLERYNIFINTNELELTTLPSVMPNPFEGDVFYEELSKASEGGINLVIANDIEDFSARRYVSGIAGSSPGPVVPTRRSAITMSLIEATGPDGRFDAEDSDNNFDTIDDSEIRLFSESIAHEILRYMGLPNTVTFSQSTVVDSDGLNSEKCSNINSCDDNDGANGNLMFPFPLSEDANTGGDDEFHPRDILSTQQVEIAQRYVGLD